MLVHKFRTSITPSSGTGSANTLKFSGGELDYVYASAASATTNFDFSLVDEDGDTIYSAENVESGFYDMPFIPVRGICTVTISNASADEAIVTKLMVAE